MSVQEVKATSGGSFKNKLLEDKARRILIAIISCSIVFLLAIIVISIIISLLRREVATASLSFNVGNPQLWAQGTTVCDPYNLERGHYRLNFYSGESTAFAHTILIWSEEEQVGRIVVPQGTPSSSLVFSHVLTQPGTYWVENYSNGTFLGQFIFTYPNACVNG